MELTGYWGIVLIIGIVLALLYWQGLTPQTGGDAAATAATCQTGCQATQNTCMESCGKAKLRDELASHPVQSEHNRNRYR